MEVDLVGSSRRECLVRPVTVVPNRPQRQLSHEGGTSKRHPDEPSRALVLERPHQALDDRDAAVLADRSEAVLNPATPAPSWEAYLRELRAPVGDEMVGSSACGRDGTVEEGTDALDVGSFVKTVTPMTRREK
jgi:hypothetical protein